ncbi:MAG: glycoside hydrolase family 3 N-terminal domain-containing protein [Campylobacterota bacterium]|nr:glycoside hydrolase family 3 N-terminal domain-containing protein [Campylobacterota bacterium]
MLFVSLPLVAQDTLEKMIGQMFMIGFDNQYITQESQICKDIKKYDLAGVILFDKNLKTKNQTLKLTQNLQNCNPEKSLLISVDQEGGKVQRLKRQYGFYGRFPKAVSVAKLSDEKTRKVYSKMAKELKSVGINFNLAPVVDLKLNKNNKVIVAKQRAYSSEPKIVAKYSSLFIDAMHKHNILTSLKHFPGHGSSLGDTHKGFVDVSKVHQDKELDPYRLLIKENKIDTIMVAHVFNKHFDSKYPASLSYDTITKKLRWHLDYHGVVISDDLQMGAISKRYTLEQTLKMAINAGNDILLFANQVTAKQRVSMKKMISIVKKLIQNGEVDIKSIEKANRRLRKLSKILQL